MGNLVDRCLARSNTYTFLSQIYLSGPIPELFSHIDAIPELAIALSIRGDESSSGQSLDQDQLAADHYHIFGLNVLPYESSFLDPNFVLEGPISERVLADCWNAGFNPDSKSESVDHIGWELKFIGELCKTQAKAERNQKWDVSRHVVAEQVSFLENHLLRWLPGLVKAIYQ